MRFFFTLHPKANFSSKTIHLSCWVLTDYDLSPAIYIYLIKKYQVSFVVLLSKEINLALLFCDKLSMETNIVINTTLLETNQLCYNV